MSNLTFFHRRPFHLSFLLILKVLVIIIQRYCSMEYIEKNNRIRDHTLQFRQKSDEVLKCPFIGFLNGSLDAGFSFLRTSLNVLKSFFVRKQLFQTWIVQYFSQFENLQSLLKRVIAVGSVNHSRMNEENRLDCSIPIPLKK